MENKFKRFLSLLLALVMVIGLMPVGHVHAEEQTYLKITELAAEVEANASYVICLHGTKNALTNQQGSEAWGSHTLATAACGDFAESRNLWTLEAADGGYKIKNAGGYLLISRNTANVNETGHIFELVYHGDAGWAIKSLETNEYGNNLGASGSIGGWSDDGTKFDLYKVVEMSAEEADPFGKLRGLWKKVSVDTETVYNETEGLFEYAWDNDPITRWHSNWQGASDKLNGSNTFSGVIDFGQAYVIDQFSFLPRQDNNNSGQVTQASLYVKEHEGDEWIAAAEHVTFEASSAKKDINFPVQAVRYVKFVAEQSNDGWVAVGEFYIDRISPVHEHSWVDATCTAPKTCATCGETEGEALGHTASEAVKEHEKAPTCTETGSYDTVVYCSVCSEELSRETTTVDALGHTEEVIPGKDATCTETGLTEGKRCTVCGVTTVAQQEIPALGHKPGEATHENEVAPDCTTDGSYESVIRCSVCSAELSRETVIVPALGHKDEDNNFKCDVCGEDLCTEHVEEIVKGYDATCTAPGMTDGKKCAICGEILEPQTVIDALVHNYEAVVTAPTCTTGGCTTYTCTVCGDTYIDDVVPALGHTEEIIPGKAATCTETGLTEGKVCTVCGITLVYQETIHMLDHTAGEVVRENEFLPDCDDAGGYDLVVRCSVCGAEMSREQVSVPALGHRNTELRDAVAPTLTNEGYTGDTFCNDCMRIIAFGEAIPMLSAMNAKILSNGTILALDNCMYVLGGEANGSYSLSHAGTYYVKPSANGNNVVNTTEKFAQLTLETTWEGKAEDDHTIRIKGLDGKTAGCGYIHIWTEGKDQPYWDRCGTAHGPKNIGTDGLYLFYKNEDGTGAEIPGYSMVTNGNVETGKSYLIAAKKGESTWYIMMPSVSTEKFDQIAQVVTDAVTHTHEYTTTTQAATCTVDGLKTDTCECGHFHTEVIPATGEHDWNAATCTAPKTCATCGATEGEALGHTASEAVKEHEKAASCTETGSYDSVVYCSVCSAEMSRETVTVAAEGHKPGEAVRENEVAPTLNSEGSYESVVYCSVCSEELSRETVTVPVLEGAAASVNDVKYATLAEAIEKAARGDSVYMLADVNEDIVIDKNIVLQMQSHTLYGQIKILAQGVQIQGSINGNTDPRGKIVAEGKHAIVIGVKDQMNAYFGLIANYVDVTSTDCVLLIYDGSATFNYADLTSTSTRYAAIQGNGREFGDVTLIRTNVTSEHEIAIYWPHAGKLAATFSTTITGATALYMKQGEAMLHSATFRATGEKADFSHSGNGAYATGDAVVLESCNYGTLDVSITSGQFISDHGKAVAVYAQPGYTELSGFISGGKYNTEVEASCIAEGYCAAFDGEYYVVAKHEYASKVTAPDCVNGGYTTYTCSRCGGSYVGDEIPALGHTASEAVKEHEKAPTCTETGSYDTVVYCSVCSAELSRETVTVAAEGHKPGEPVRENEVAPTLNSEGSYDEVIYCSVCSAELSRTTVTVPMLEGAVASANGVKYATLAEAIEKAPVGHGVHMLADVTEDIVIDKNIALYMESHTLYGQIKILAQGVQIMGCANRNTDPKAKIVAVGKDAIVIGVKDQKNENISLLANDVDVTSTTDCALLIYDGSATFSYCDLTSTSTSYAAVQGSGRDFGDVTMMMCNVTSEYEVAVYWPHTGTLRLNNCVITGTTGLYIKQGEASLNSGTVKATGAQVAYTPNNNGGNSTGDAITIDKGATEPVVNTSANLISENGNLVGMYGGTVELFGANLTAKKNAIRMEDGVLNLRGMTINAGYCALFIRGGEVNMSSTTLNSTGDYAAIQGNGLCGGNVNIATTTINANDIAIYWPGSGNLNIASGIITGATAIYAKQGNVTISGGNFRATGEKVDFSHGGNGAYATGDAVVLESCDYGTLTASITYGQFISDHGKAVAAYAQPGHTELSGFITGGHYNTEVDAAYLAEGYCAALTGEYYSVAQHYYFSEVTDPDCENDGFTTHTCGRCGDSYVTDEIPALGHTPAEAVIENEVAPTCTENGSYDSVICCSVCSDEISRHTVTVDALGHSEQIIPAVDATCTATGLTEGKQCTVCGETLVAQEETPALGHDWHGRDCSRCDEQYANPFMDVPEDEFYVDPVLWALQQGITAGTSENTFSPYKNVTRSEAVTFLWRAVGSPEPTTEVNPFEDVTEGDYFYKAVLWAYEAGVTAGVEENIFAPHAECTRAQIVTFLWRAMGSQESDAEVTFVDVLPDSYYANAVAWAVEHGITAGMGGGYFGADSTCTRAQVVTFLYRTKA